VLLPRSAIEGSASADYLIKGNVNRNGERIYHMPNQQILSKHQNGCWRWQAVVLQARGVAKLVTKKFR
jgi:hypothetical protein